MTRRTLLAMAGVAAGRLWADQTSDKEKLARIW